MLAPVLRLTVLVVLADAREVADHYRADIFLNTLLNDVFRERVEVVRPSIRFLLVQSRGLLRVRVIILGEPLAEVVVVLLQTVQWVQLAMAVLIVFEVRRLRDSDAVVLGVEFESGGLKHHR